MNYSIASTGNTPQGTLLVLRPGICEPVLWLLVVSSHCIQYVRLTVTCLLQTLIPSTCVISHWEHWWRRLQQYVISSLQNVKNHKIFDVHKAIQHGKSCDWWQWTHVLHQINLQYHCFGNARDDISRCVFWWDYERRLKLSMHYYLKTRACTDNPAHYALHEFDPTTRDLYLSKPNGKGGMTRPPTQPIGL